MFMVNLIAAAGHALTEWRHKQQAFAELMALDDRTLADIGIHRSQIPGIVDGSEDTSREASDRNRLPAFGTHKLAGGHTWFPWFPPL